MQIETTIANDRRRMKSGDYDALFTRGHCFIFALRLNALAKLSIRGMETNEPGKIGHVWCLFEKGGKPLGVDIRGIYPEKALMCWALGWSKKCKDLGPPRDVDVAEVEAAIEEKKLPPDFKDEVCILAGRIILEHERFKDLWKSPVSAENEAQLINCIEDS